MRVGISTACLFPTLTETALKEILLTGTKTVEVFLNSPCEGTVQFAQMLRRMADDAGAGIAAIHPFSSEYEGVGFFGRYPRRFADAMLDYQRYFEICNAAGAGILAFHGARSLFPIEPDLYCERFGLLAEAGKRAGVTVCQENVVHFLSGQVDFIRRMRLALPGACFLLDVKQAVRAGEEPLEMLAAMGTGLRHVHISDHARGQDCLVPGQGDGDLAGLMHALREMDYRGAIIIEVYRRNFSGYSELAESERLLHNMINFKQIERKN